jgi:hypothetical protein
MGQEVSILRPVPQTLLNISSSFISLFGHTSHVRMLIDGYPVKHRLQVDFLRVAR